jgi:hypothetical protein
VDRAVAIARLLTPVDRPGIEEQPTDALHHPILFAPAAVDA